MNDAGLKSGRILVVDDDDALVRILVEYLQKLGYEADAARDGISALDRFDGGGYQSVLLDLGLPDMDGMEVLRRMQVRDSQAAVIVLTGSGTIENAVAAIRSGAYDFIAKPADLKSLELIVDRAMERCQLQRQRGVFRGLTLALLISVPLWLVLGILLARVVF
ncbi:MAG: response regulator [Desulfobacterales bacterium]|nr:response regulator [Desulfobacterales bacterium]